MKMTDELKEKARAASSPEELAALAKAEGAEMSEEQAQSLFSRLHPAPGEVSDEELSAVAGGGCGKEEEYSKFDPVCPLNLGDTITLPYHSPCPNCGSRAWVVTAIGFPYRDTDGTNYHGTCTPVFYATWDVWVKCAGCGQTERKIKKQSVRWE